MLIYLDGFNRRFEGERKQIAIRDPMPSSQSLGSLVVAAGSKKRPKKE